jgi:hypothetical protein
LHATALLYLKKATLYFAQNLKKIIFMSKYTLFFFFFGLLVCLSACQNAKEKLIIGEWQFVRIYVQQAPKEFGYETNADLLNEALQDYKADFMLTFFEDNTVMGFETKYPKKIQAYQWRADGSYITLNPKNAPKHYEIKLLTSDSLIMKYEYKIPLTFVFARKS